MIRPVLLASLLAVLAVAAPARASRLHPRRGARAGTAAEAGVRFLGMDPIGPLAIVHGGVVETPGKHACRTWAPDGSRWHALDAFGRIAGDVIIKGRDYYYYTECDELAVRRVSGHDGAGIFVDARAAYHAPRVAPWQPDRKAWVALENIARAHQRGIPRIPAVHRPLAKRVFFFDWVETGERYAVVGGRSLIVLSFRRGRWVIAYEKKPEGAARDDAHVAFAVTDMNGDGRPEIVYHHQEAGGEWYGDWTVSLGADGTWHEVRAGIFGSTA
jgi:hypothetical protein